MITFSAIGTTLLLAGIAIHHSFHVIGVCVSVVGLCINGLGPYFLFNMSRENTARIVVRRWAKKAAMDCEAGTANWGPPTTFCLIVTIYTTLVVTGTIYEGLSPWFLILSPIVTVLWLLLFCRPHCSGAIDDFEDEEAQGLLSSSDSESWSS